MKSVMRLSVGLLLAASVVGCNTCQQSCNPCQPSCNPCPLSCLHKLFGNSRGGGCCQDTQCWGGCGQAVASCDCGQSHASPFMTSNTSCAMPTEAMVHGYGKSVAYTGDDWQDNPQPMVGQMPMTGGCASCGGGNVTSHSAPGGCASCGSGMQSAPKIPPIASGNGGCASCAAGATSGSLYNPIESQHLMPTPAPTPPAESIPGVPNETPFGDKPTSQGESIQKINWVPRQL
jgi:hypothetical protein